MNVAVMAGNRAFAGEQDTPEICEFAWKIHDISIAYRTTSARSAACRNPDSRRRRQSAPGLADRRRTDRAGRAGARRHQGQQARRRRRNPERHVPAAAIVVARRPPPAAADISAGSRHRPGRCLVRRPRKPPLQPAGTAERDRGGDRLRRDDHLYDFIVEIDHNTLAAHRRTRQRGIPASGAREFWTDRGVRFDDEIGDAAVAASGWGQGRRS